LLHSRLIRWAQSATPAACLGCFASKGVLRRGSWAQASLDQTLVLPAGRLLGLAANIRLVSQALWSPPLKRLSRPPWAAGVWGRGEACVQTCLKSRPCRRTPWQAEPDRARAAWRQQRTYARAVPLATAPACLRKSAQSAA